jgi:hypothetical protein
MLLRELMGTVGEFTIVTAFQLDATDGKHNGGSSPLLAGCATVPGT